MRYHAAIFLLMLGTLQCAGQVVDAPCVPRFRTDPSYIAVSEASGGQILLLDRTEIANPAITRAHSGANHETILRVSGTLGAGSQEFTAPVDSGVQSLQFAIFAECMKSITVTAPSGAQAEGTRLSSGRIVVLDAPEHGEWRVKLAGTGYFTAVAQAKGGVVFPPLRLERPKPGLEQSLVAYLAGPVETAEFRIVARNGATLQVIPMTQIGDTEFRGVFTPPAEPFHIAVEGKDKQGLAFRRIHAPLLDAKQ